MKQEYSCAALFIDAEQICVHNKVEVDRRNTLKSSNIKYFKLTVQYFFMKVINKNESITMFLEVHTHH
jgi:hypothetical protein